MRRPLAAAGFSAFAALIAVAFLKLQAVWALAALCGACGGVCAFLAARKSKRFIWPCYGAVVFLTASVSLFLYSAAWEKTVRPALELDGREARIRGTVLDYPQEKNGTFYYIVKVDRLAASGGAWGPAGFTVRLSSWFTFPCEPYDMLEVDVRFYEFSSEGLYSAMDSRLAKGIAIGAALTAYEDPLVIPGTGGNAGGFFIRLRHRLLRSLNVLLPRETAALIQAMLLADRDHLPDSVYAAFQRTGSSHLLVISGLHVTAISGFFSLLFGHLPIGRLGQALLTAGSLLCFLAVIAFPVSAVRAGLMYLLFLLAGCFGRQADGVNSLGFAVLVVCLWNPFSGMDLGFLLSVLATLGLQTVYPALRAAMLKPFSGRRLRGWIGPGVSCGAATFSALLYTLPVQTLVFRGLPLLAPLASLVLVAPCTLLLYSSFLLVLLGLLPAFAPMAAPLAAISGWTGRFVLWAARVLGKVPGAYLALGRDTWLIVLGTELALLLLCFTQRGLAARRAALLMGMALLAAAGMFEACRWNGVVTVAVADPNQSGCVLLLKNREAVLLTAGGYDQRAAQRILTENNIQRLDTVYLPFQDQEALAAVSFLLETFPARRVILPQGAYGGQIPGVEPSFLNPGESFQALPGIEVSVAEDGSLSFLANGLPAMLELEDAGSGSCGLLITSREDSRINSPFTVLRADGIMGANAGHLLPGEALGPEGSLFSDGKASGFSVQDINAKHLLPEKTLGRAGAYLTVGGQGCVYLDISRDGSIRIRR